MVEMRIYAKEQFENLFPTHGEELEAKLYEKIQQHLPNMHGMDFYLFRKRYKMTLKSILLNMQRSNSGLIKMLKELPETNSTSIWSILSKNPKEWEPDLWKLEIMENVEEETMRTGTFDCGNCARKGMYSKNTSHYEKQTRSADEPMTIFMHCHTCGKDYRFSS